MARASERSPLAELTGRGTAAVQRLAIAIGVQAHPLGPCPDLLPPGDGAAIAPSAQFPGFST